GVGVMPRSLGRESFVIVTIPPPNTGASTRLGSGCLRRKSTDILDRTARAIGNTRLAGVASVQDQPVMCIQPVFRWDHPMEFVFHFAHGLAGREACTVRHAEDVR